MMFISAYHLVLILCCILLTTAQDENNSTKATPLEIKKMLEEKCTKEYSLTCLKLDLAAYVPMLSTHRNFRLLPGLIVEFGGYKSKIVGRRLPVEEAEPALDMYLLHGLDSFMDSLSLKIKVMDREIVDKVKDIGFKVFSATSVGTVKESTEARGRRKKINHALLVGGMVSAGTLLALTMSAISAMAGKAIIASILSLALTLMNRNGNGGGAAPAGGGPAKTTYEIITHSVPHHDYDYNRHTWSAEPATAHEAYQYVKGVNPGQHQIHVS